MYDQQQSPPLTSQGGYPPNYPPTSYPPPPEPPRSTNGLAIAGLILAFLMAPIGLILSIVGLVQAGRRGQKGKGLAIAGVVVSLLSIVTATVAVVALSSAAVNTISTLADPGCTAGRAAILDNQAKVSNTSDVDGMKAGLQATITGLKDAGAKAKHDNVRAATNALADDYNQLLNALNAAAVPDASLQSKLSADGATFDSLCA
jgi:hypothetical protein